MRVPQLIGDLDRYAQELNLASMLHLKVMLRQMLTIEGIPNIREWEEVLLRLALRIAREMTFAALPHRQGQDMDVRRYVKIKKIPGGTPRDSEYVNGAVITKNVAHKQMSRLQKNPRVMLVTFPLDFSRVEGQYMHFDQILRQEKKYLGNLASRIAALRPHVVLVEQSVSRLALEALAHYNIAVARTVKPSAIQTISRMTQGDVFSSMDKLALEPRLGHCARFCIQSYDHPLIPGQRKTYMRFEGCNQDMGCTIILRGGDLETLRRIKKVTCFLAFIVRNLKLETHLWKDSVISLPSFNPQAIPSSGSRHLQLNRSLTFLMSPVSFPSHRIPTSSVRPPLVEVTSVVGSNYDLDLPNEDAEQLRLTRRIDESLEPYTNTFISVSATLRFPPPYPIRRMKELDNSLMDAKRAWEDEIVRIEERLHSMHKQEETVKEVAMPAGTLDVPEPQQGGNRDDIVAQIDALVVIDRSTTCKTKDGLPPASTLDDGQCYFTFKPGLPNTLLPDTSLALMQSGSNLQIEEPECPKTEADIYHQSRYSLLKWQHEEHRRIWEWYLRKNQDDFVVEKYQCIHLREYTIPAPDAGHRPCFAPCLRRIKFYGENDLTLGQFIEKAVNDTQVQFLDPKAICTGKGCDQPLARHCKVYVHNETRLFVAVEQWGGQIIEKPLNYPSPYPSPDLITTWSACRVCGSATPFIPVSEEMQRYSFAKFLELHFYPADVKLVQGAGCQHNIYQHHIRYFASSGMTVRFQADPVVPHELVYPPFRIRVRPETQLELKNDEFKRLHYRNIRWYSGLVDELKLISIDASTGDEETDARLLADVNALIIRAEAEREDICRLINQLYRDSLPTDTLALNKVHAYRRDKRVAWQIDFDRLPKVRPPQPNRNSKRSSAFGSVRSMWPRRYDLPTSFDNPYLPSSSVSEAEEDPSKTRITSSASETSEPESGADSEKGGVDLEKGGIDLGESGVDLEITSTDADVVVTTSTDADVVVDGQTPREDKAKSDPDSDSTIGAAREEVALPTTFAPPENVSFIGSYIAFTILLTPFLQEQDPGMPTEDSTQRASRLPRRVTQSLSVAELVKKYQDFLPAQGVHALTQTAFAPRSVMSESEQEYPSQLTLRPGTRSKSRHRVPVKKVSTSDFEQGYVANVAPRYSRRSVTETNKTRIPAPIGSSFESHESSRRPSPEKRFSGQGKAVRDSRPSSPPANKNTQFGGKTGKNRVPSRSKDKPAMRLSLTTGNKSTFRRSSTGAGIKVPNIAKHFERLSRDAERSKSRYTIIRSKRARPVASARAKVQVLESLKDAIGDDSEISDASSEADDEDEGNEEERPLEPVVEKQPPEPEQNSSKPTSEAAPSADTFPIINLKPPDSHDAGDIANVSPERIHSPASPFLSAVKTKNDATLTPPTSDQEPGSNGAEKSSILKALSGFWPQPVRHSMEGDDSKGDPEHIFRDSSMVVRTDEPTSIIALALEYVFYYHYGDF